LEIGDQRDIQAHTNQQMRGYTRFTRVASLAPFQLSGGDAAVREPARVGLSLLHAVGLSWDESLEAVQRYTPAQREILRVQLERRIGCVETTSMGRFLDACAALLGVRQVVSHEGQAAIEMEQLAHRFAPVPGTEATRTHDASFRFDVEVGPDGRLLMVSRSVLERLLAARRAGEDRAAIAFSLHVAIAEAMVRVAVDARDRFGAMPVGVTGGVFQNRLLSQLACDGLRAQGFTVLTHRLVPANDGGLALGQALIAMHTHLDQTPDGSPSPMFSQRP
jgi:hydrogenase maturation protein HypF